MVLAARAAVGENGLGQRQAAKKFGVTKTAVAECIMRKFKAPGQRGRKPFLDKATEALIAEHVSKAAELCRGYTTKDVIGLAKAMAVKFGWNFDPTFRWFDGFMRRHPELSKSTAKKHTAARLKGFSREAWHTWYTKYEAVVAKFTAKAILNIDDSGWDLEQGSTKKVSIQMQYRDIEGLGTALNMSHIRLCTLCAYPCLMVCLQIVHRKGGARPRFVGAHKNGHIDLTFTLTADGKYLPPIWTFEGQRMTKDRVPKTKNSKFNLTKNGHSDHTTFLLALGQIKDYMDEEGLEETLLVVDNAAVHSSLTILEYAIDNRITIMGLPPATTSFTQPLDVCFFGPLKKKVEALTKNAPTEQNVPVMVEKALAEMEAAAHEDNKRLGATGWKDSGLWPANRHAHPDSAFAFADEAHDVSATHPDVLKASNPSLDDIAAVIAEFDEEHTPGSYKKVQAAAARERATGKIDATRVLYTSASSTKILADKAELAHQLEENKAARKAAASELKEQKQAEKAAKQAEAAAKKVEAAAKKAEAVAKQAEAAVKQPAAPKGKKRAREPSAAEPAPSAASGTVIRLRVVSQKTSEKPVTYITVDSRE